MKEATFQNLSHLNSTLTSLEISGSDLQFEGAVFLWFPLLTHLALTLEELDSLPDSLFHGLNQLENLNLAYNDLETVPSNAFEFFAQTENLKSLDLTYNKLSEVRRNDFRALSSLNHLYLEANNLLSVGPSLNAMPDLTTLTVQTLMILRETESKHYLEHLELFPFQDYGDLHPYTFALPLCELAPQMQHAILPNFRINKLSELLGNSCINLKELDISGCLKNTNFKETKQTQIYAPNLQRLHAARNDLETLKQLESIFNVSSLLYLDISGNVIDHIDIVQAASFLQHLEYLDVTNNDLQSLQFLEKIPSLRTLKAGSNKIQQIPDFLLKRLSESSTLVELDLGDNHFHCSCAIKQFQVWITTDDQVHLLSGKKYACTAPASTVGQSITEVKLDCRSYLPLHLGLGLLSGVVLCAIIIVAVHYRWHIRYKAFLLCNWRKIKRTSDSSNMLTDISSSNHRYDAYVAYVENSDSDLNWVFNDLRPNIEESDRGKLTLCIKGRDFLLGRAIVDNIFDAIQQSRKTILVLSRQFVQCEWCYFEMQMAQMRLFQEHLDVLILVLLEDIPDDMFTLTLRQLLCRKQYFKWPSDNLGRGLFWQRLREEIKKPGSLDRRYDA